MYAFDINATRSIKTDTGHLYNSFWLRSHKSVDDAWASAYHDTEMGFWYKTKRYGQVEVWIEAEAADVRHNLDIWDNWGWSDSYVSQNHYLTLRVGNARRSANMSWFWRDGYTDGHWQERYLSENGIYWAHLSSVQNFPQNSWVFIWIGCRTHSWCESNDVAMDCVPVARWFIKSVSIE